MPIQIENVTLSTQIVIAALLLALLAGFRRANRTELLPVDTTQELKGLGMLTIVFAHIAYMLVTDGMFLYPLSIAAGVGVDLFLFMSGFGLTVGMLKKPMGAAEFYQRRLIKVFIPFWIALILLFAANAVFHHLYYSPMYMLQSFLGWFPRASAWEDVNSPFWYITWMLVFYALFPLLFMRERPWLTAILLAVIATLIGVLDPLNLQTNWLHRLHTFAFSFGILVAWWLRENKGKASPFVEDLKWFRSKSGGIGRYLVLLLSLAGAGYMAYHNSSEHWSQVSALIAQVGLGGPAIGQATSLLTMGFLLIFFAMKRFELKFLNLFGVYSYETYLLHWPLMSRYDVFYHYLPAWLATIAWIAAFIGIGWLLQKVTAPVGAWVDKVFAKG